MEKQIRMPLTSNELDIKLNPDKQFLDNYFDTVTVRNEPAPPNSRKGFRDYLNAEEANDFLFLAITSLHMQRYINNFEKHGNITKQEHQEAQMSATYLYKFINRMASRLTLTQREVFMRKMTKYGIKVMDAYTEKKLYGEFDKEMKVLHIESEQFLDFCSEIMQVKCNHCTKNHESCDLHKLLYDNWIPESSYNLPNCRFAYDNNYKKEGDVV